MAGTPRTAPWATCPHVASMLASGFRGQLQPLYRIGNLGAPLCSGCLPLWALQKDMRRILVRRAAGKAAGPHHAREPEQHTTADLQAPRLHCPHAAGASSRPRLAQLVLAAAAPTPCGMADLAGVIELSSSICYVHHWLHTHCGHA